MKSHLIIALAIKRSHSKASGPVIKQETNFACHFFEFLQFLSQWQEECVECRIFAVKGTVSEGEDANWVALEKMALAFDSWTMRNVLLCDLEWDDRMIQTYKPFSMKHSFLLLIIYRIVRGQWQGPRSWRSYFLCSISRILLCSQSVLRPGNRGEIKSVKTQW